LRIQVASATAVLGQFFQLSSIVSVDMEFSLSLYAKRTDSLGTMGKSPPSYQ